jgi:transcriptional regulator with XRE-family HTH domain
LSMSQAQLADATEIGIASIKRWERGLIIQGAALDRQLRNLEPEVMHEAVSPWAGTFRTNITEAARQRAQNFTLRPRQSRQLEAMACM